MFIQPFLFYGIGIIAICLVVIIIAIALLYVRLNRAYSQLKTEFTLYKRDNEKQAQEALNTANAKAKEIINGTEIFTVEMKEALKGSIDQSLISGKATYEQIISDIGNKNTKDLIAFGGSLRNSMATQATSLTDNYKKALQEERETFSIALSQGEQKILEELKAKSAEMLVSILKKTLQKTITRDEAEKLVIDSIESIKKEYGFR